MKKKKILHVLSPDKFTLPFIELINKEFDPTQHYFLCNEKPSDAFLETNKNVYFLHSPYRKNLFANLILFFNSVRSCSKIIWHGNPILFMFGIFQFALKKTYWVIYGYELASTNTEIQNTRYKIWAQLKKFVLKKVYAHVVHIKGESDLANILFKSKAKYFYSPGYLSNIISEEFIGKKSGSQVDKCVKVLIGNSTSPTNQHLSILDMLKEYKSSNMLFYCPLSYGIYHEYRDMVIEQGIQLFGDKFIPITNFMKPEEYNLFLSGMDIAVFNHNRQEAMGVTITLLGMGKIVYMNPTTSSFESLSNRGFNVYDNNLIKNGGILLDRDLSSNQTLIRKYYSYDILINSWKEIFADK